jgi:exodeoxyribonuclease V alpha subunit
LINAIQRILAAKKLRILLSTTTGWAARRMSDTTDLDAKTIHRLQEFDPAPILSSAMGARDATQWAPLPG